jgi:predicted glycoside hydrolase/deacetylase ChbG (UPF0249 family)
VIVNADDFGLDHSTNQGIALAFERGLISSTTVMANQAGFDEAVELAHDRRLGQHLGVHLVLTSGTPLTEPIRRLGRFCDAEGSFRVWLADARAWRISGREREAVLRELRAQVDRVRAADLPVTHVDSHHHVHNEWGVAGCVIAVARAAGIGRVRIARNCGAGIGVGSSVYKRLLNARLRRHELAGTRWFGEAEHWLHLQAKGADPASLEDFEVMTHPTLDPDGKLVDSVSEPHDLAALLAPVTPARSAVSFAGARYAG